MAIRTAAKALLKGIATKAAKVTSDTVKVATTNGTTVGAKTAKNALKGGVVVGGAGGTAAGYLLSRPSVDTDGDGAGDTDPVTYIIDLPGQILAGLGGVVKDYWWILPIAGLALIMVVRK